MRIPEILKRRKTFGVLKVFYKSYESYKKRIIALSALGVLSGFAEVVGINAIIPLFGVMLGEQTGGDDVFTKIVNKTFDFLGLSFTPWSIVGFIIALFLIRSLIIVVFNYVMVSISAEFERTARTKLLADTFRAKWQYLVGQKLGKLNTYIISHVDVASRGLTTMSQLIMTLTGMLMFVLVAVDISASFSALIMGVGFFSIIVFKAVYTKVRKLSELNTTSQEEVTHFVHESVSGLKTIKSSGVWKSILHVGEEYFKKLEKYRIGMYVYQNAQGVGMQFFSVVFVCLLFVYSTSTGWLSFGEVIVLIYLVQRIFSYVTNLQNILHTLNSAYPQLRSVQNYIDEVSREREPKSGESDFKFEKEISFSDVSFDYGSTKIIDNVNFDIKKGETIGLIGPSGAGKTTIVDMLLGLLQPVEGQILVDGKNIREISPKAWHKRIGYVSQDNFLLNDTIYKNIAFFKDDISESDVKRAAKLANIEEFINSQEHGYDTMVGERGLKLSGGQRQRIAIARVIAQNPEVLVLDEATSALDNESELKIQNVIHGLRGKITVFIIAHRLNTVRDADRIIVLDSGKVVESGSPEELRQNSESYFSRMLTLKKDSQS